MTEICLNWKIRIIKKVNFELNPFVILVKINESAQVKRGNHKNQYQSLLK